MKAKPLRTLPAKVFLSILALCLTLGCGDEGVIIVIVNTGVVVSDDACDGQFNIHNDDGLLLVVVIGSDTPVFLPNGVPGTCANIQFGARASVSGPIHNGRVTASQVQLE